MPSILLYIGSYLLGSIPFAVITSRLFGLDDPRHYGSGNPGATNVLRSGNKIAALLTLLGDSLKGWFAVWLALRLGFTPVESACAGVIAFLGHVFSCFLRFKGGKGVATALGVLFGIDSRIALISLGTWLLVVYVSRYSSAAALGAALITPIAGFWFFGFSAIPLALLVMAGILVWRHTNNIQRLLNGTEGRFHSKKSSPESPPE